MNTSLLNSIELYPCNVASAFDLVYTTPDILRISRKKSSNKFLYFLDDKLLMDSNTLSRIKSLKIPPAWSDVKIAYLDNAHLLAIGYDKKKRKQYIYNPVWSALKNETKFYKMSGFAEALPVLRKRVINDIEQKTFTKSKVLAIVIRLLEESHIRIGNSYYEKRNKTYGLSTLRTRHLHLFKNKFKLEFTGKRGKKHSITIRNKKLLKLINQCEEIPGWELFQYFDEDGNKHSIDSTMINGYIHETCGDMYSAKDFRTWSASVIAFETLRDLENNNDMKKEKAIIKAIDSSAEALNNTRSVSRKYYVHPQIIQSYQDNSILPYFNLADKSKRQNETGLQTNEIALKALIDTYQPKIIFHDKK